MGRIWWVVTNVYTYVATTQIKSRLFSITLKMPTCPSAVNTPHTPGLRQLPTYFLPLDISFPFGTIARN